MGHIVITGPGRSGTTFLVQLLTRMGEDTGFTPYQEPFVDEHRAGCEFGDINYDEFNGEVDITPEEARAYSAEWPHVFKAPDWSWMLKGYLAKDYIDIDHLIVPFRDLDEAAQSRLSVGLDWMVDDRITDPLERLGVQAAVHAMMLGRAVEVAYLYRIPLHVMRFPDFIQSARYCYERLTRIFGFDYDTFEAKHKELSWLTSSQKILTP